MRLVAGLLALTLFAPFVRAEDTAAPPTPAPAAPEPARARAALRVIRIMPESHQALLFDRGRATYVLAEVGAKIGDYVVDDIDAEEVTLSRGSTQLVLAAPATDADHRGAPQGAPAVRASDSGRSDAAPVDPYGDEVRSVSASGPPAAAGDAPVAPGAGGVRVASAPSAASARPIAPGDDGVRVASAPNIPDEAPAAVRATAAPSVSPPWSSSAAIPQASGGLPVAGPSTTAAPPAAPAAAPPAATAPPPAAPPAATSALPAAAAPSPAAPPAASLPAAPLPAAAPPPASAAPLPVSAPPLPASAPPLAASAPQTKASKASQRRPAKKPPARTAGNRQTLDALAMADMMSGDSPRRGPRGPAIEAPADDARATSASSAAAPAAAAPAASASSGSRTAPADTIVLSRAEVDGALGDFASLSTAIQASFSPAGVIVEHLAENTIFERAGLLPGDTIASINGMRLRSLDDAADLYARAATASTLTVQLLRNGRPATLHLAIQ